MKQEAEKEMWDLWTLNWKYAKLFFECKGNTKTKSQYKKQWCDAFYKAVNLSSKECEKRLVMYNNKKANQLLKHIDIVGMNKGEIKLRIRKAASYEEQIKQLEKEKEELVDLIPLELLKKQGLKIK